MADINLFDRIVVVDAQIENKRDTNHINAINGGTGSSGEDAQQRSQEFLAMGSSLTAFSFKLFKSGAPTDDLTVTITSSPGGSALGSKSIASASLTSGALNTFTFASPITLTPGSIYYAEVSRSGSRDAVNRWNIYLDLSTSMYAQDIYIKSNNAWTLDATTSDYHFTASFAGNPTMQTTDNISVFDAKTVSESVNVNPVGLSKDTITVSESVSIGRPHYWVGDGGNWTDTAHWSFTSGGSGGAPAPTQYDPVIFDANSFNTAGQTVSIDNTARGRSVDFSAIDVAATLAFLASYDLLITNGSVTLSSLLTVTSATTGANSVWITTNPGNDVTLNTFGISFPVYLLFNLDSKVTLQSNITAYALDQGVNNSTYLSHLDTAGYDISVTYFYATATSTRLTLSDSIITLTGTSPSIEIANESYVSSGTSKIITSATSGTTTVDLDSVHMYDFEQQDSNVFFSSGAYFRNITLKDGGDVKVTNGRHIFVTGTLSWTNTSTRGELYASTPNGSPFKIFAPNTSNTVTNVGIKDSTANTTQLNYTQSDIAYSAHTMTGAATSVVLADDAVSTGISLPFSFTFFGTSYSTIYIGSNGLVGFATSGMTSGYPDSIPNSVTPNAVIHGYHTDLDPSDGGTIKYETFGSTPNRVFVVEYSAVPDWDILGTSNTFQIKLFESGNIEIHALSCPNTGGRYNLQGIEDSSGGFASWKSGRNCEPFSLTNDGVRFAPGTTTDVTWNALSSADRGGNTGWTFEHPNKNDTVTVSEYVTFDYPLAFSVADTITTTENITVERAYNIVTSDVVTITESLSFSYSFNVSSYDSISLGDSQPNVGATVIWNPRTDNTSIWENIHREDDPGYEKEA